MLQVWSEHYPSAEDVQDVICKLAEVLKKTHSPNPAEALALHDSLTNLSCGLDDVIDREKHGCAEVMRMKEPQSLYFSTIGLVDQPNSAS